MHICACRAPKEPAIRCGDHCGQNAACQRQLAETQLSIIPGTSPGEVIENHQELFNRITISEPTVLNAYQPALNEYFILHELGHSCQASRHQAFGNPLAVQHAYDTPAYCNDDTSAWSDMQQLMPAVARCLRAPLVQSSHEWRGANGETACRASWAQEAFADSIFAFRKVLPNAWGWDCHGTAGSDHGTPTLIHECIIRNPPVATNVLRTSLLQQYCCGVGLTPSVSH